MELWVINFILVKEDCEIEVAKCCSVTFRLARFGHFIIKDIRWSHNPMVVGSSLGVPTEKSYPRYNAFNPITLVVVGFLLSIRILVCD